jgi:hypothetical protein
VRVADNDKSFAIWREDGLVAKKSEVRTNQDSEEKKAGCSIHWQATGLQEGSYSTM